MTIRTDSGEIRLPAAAAIVALCLFVASCGGESARDEETEQTVPASPEESETIYTPAATSVNWDEKVQLVPVTYDAWKRELEALEGQILVVDYWATWCVPCRERFPHMVDMAERFEPRGVTFVSLSLDDRDDVLTPGDVTEFLQKQNARMPNYLMDEIIPDAFEKLDLLGIPAVEIYDHDGSLVEKLTGDDPNRQFTEADVEAAVLELLDRR